MATQKVTDSERVEFKRIASMTGWSIADHFGCAYSGDSSPIPHEGFFYDARDWEAYGYASAVEFWMEGDTVLVVSCGTIHRPDDDDMAGAFACIGIAPGSPDRDNVHAQIEACRAYGGIEPDDHEGSKRYRLDSWQEWRIWRSVAGWLRPLGAGE